MTVYIEYAFLENFLFDGALLFLAFTAARAPMKWWRICLSAFCGAIFALLFPLLKLPTPLLVLLKIAVGLLLCLLATQRLKTKKEWGRYALSCVLFFVFTFAFGGALTGIAGRFAKVNSLFVVIGFAILTVISLILIGVLYKKKAVHKYVYPCEILYKQRSVDVLGYLDSGNLAAKNGLPVCFLSADVFYDLFGEELLFEKEERGGQVRDEMTVHTVSGAKTLVLFKAVIKVKQAGKKTTKKDTYFAIGQNIISREYKLLLNASIVEG